MHVLETLLFKFGIKDIVAQNFGDTYNIQAARWEDNGLPLTRDELMDINDYMKELMEEV
jgi:hypothetical protein